ncbi:MAG: hypothetical protein M3279_04695, partial [Actinomycetota bacterium]|nr:hypothetical protein [Actinomycetota bacterium]
MMVRTKPAMCAAVSVALSIGGCGGSDEQSSPRAPGNGEPTETACPYVEARPTYLPWLDEGGEVPQPEQAVENGTSYVAWSTGEADPSEQKSVIFRRDAEPLGGRGE